MSPVVRDALAFRRWWRRDAGRLGMPQAIRDLDAAHRWRADFGADSVARHCGLAAYVPDPPLPLP